MLVEQLGAGGMGVVFRAKDTQLNRDVAIKVLLDHSDDRAARLIREAQAMAQLSHAGERDGRAEVQLAALSSRLAARS